MPPRLIRIQKNVWQMTSAVGRDDLVLRPQLRLEALELWAYFQALAARLIEREWECDGGEVLHLLERQVGNIDVVRQIRQTHRVLERHPGDANRILRRAESRLRVVEVRLGARDVDLRARADLEEGARLLHDQVAIAHGLLGDARQRARLEIRVKSLLDAEDDGIGGGL